MKTTETTIKLNERINASSSPDNITDENVNTFFHKLEEHLSDKTSTHLNNIRNSDFELHRQNTISKSSYNTAGNLSLMCYVPIRTDAAPNFVGLVVNDTSNESDNPQHPLMRILLDWIKSNDMLTSTSSI